MTWAEISWILVAALLVTLVTATLIALVQVLSAARLSALGRLAWAAAIVVVPPIAVPLWFAYGRPRSAAFTGESPRQSKS